MNFITWLIEAIKSNGPSSVFIGGVFEEIVIPIPSPIISMAGGAFLINTDKLLEALIQIFTKVSLPFALGATLGSTLAYLMAFFGGKFLIEKLHKYLGFNWRTVEKTRKKFIKGSGDEIAIVLLRGIPVVPVSLISAVCGAIRYDWKAFYFFTFLGLIMRSFILGILGWQAGVLYKNLAEDIDKLENIVMVVTLLLISAILGFLYYKREKFLKD